MALQMQQNHSATIAVTLRDRALSSARVWGRSECRYCHETGSPHLRAGTSQTKLQGADVPQAYRQGGAEAERWGAAAIRRRQAVDGVCTKRPR